MNRSIELVGGPYNGRTIEDSGSVVVRMALYETGKPEIGKRVGEAIYERSQDKPVAFYLDSKWLGVCDGLIGPDDLPDDDLGCTYKPL